MFENKKLVATTLSTQDSTTVPALGTLIALVVVCALALTGCAGAGERTVVVSDAAATPTVSVTGNSEIKVVPDKAKIGVAVTSQAATAAATQEQNAADVNAVIEALKALGIDEKSVQTTYSYLNPRYDLAHTYTTPQVEIVEDGIEGLAEADEIVEEDTSSNIVGYEMTTSLSVADLDIDQVGEVLRACVAAGANNTDGIQYYSSEYDAKYAQALAAAVEEAHAKAEVLAAAAGAKLAAVYSMTEGYQNMAYKYDSGMGAMEAAAADTEEDSMSVMPGEVEITASVTVAYELQ